MTNNIQIALDVADDIAASVLGSLPTEDNILVWMQAVHSHLALSKPFEVSLRIVSEQESQLLNTTYRNKAKPTNVLSFESELPEFVESDFIGDLAICAAVVAKEANEQHKPEANHWAHMCIHGLLHLLGFDHIQEQEAVEMEAIEVAVLAQLGIDDPYQIS